MLELLSRPLAIAVPHPVARRCEVAQTAHELVVTQAEDVVERVDRPTPLAALELTFRTPERGPVTRVRRRPFVFVLFSHDGADIRLGVWLPRTWPSTSRAAPSG